MERMKNLKLILGRYLDVKKTNLEILTGSPVGTIIRVFSVFLFVLLAIIPYSDKGLGVIILFIETILMVSLLFEAIFIRKEHSSSNIRNRYLLMILFYWSLVIIYFILNPCNKTGNEAFSCLGDGILIAVLLSLGVAMFIFLVTIQSYQ